MERDENSEEFIAARQALVKEKGITAAAAAELLRAKAKEPEPVKTSRKSTPSPDAT